MGYNQFMCLKKILLVFLACLGFWGLGTQAVLAASSDLKYQLDLSLDVETLTLRGEAKITYQNPGPRELKSLFFRLDANTKSVMEVQEVKTADGLILPSRPYSYTYLEQEIQDPVFYEVFLPEPLKVGASTELDFSYVIRHLPRNQDSVYLLDDLNQLGLGSWYPRLVPFRDGRWQMYARQTADYEVSARANGKLFVISPLAPVSVSNADHSYHYSAERAQELSLIYTPDLLLRSTEYDKIPIRFYYHSDLQKWSPLTLEVIQSALKFFRDRYSTYPSRRLTVVSIEDSPYPVIVSDDLLILRNSFSPDADEDVVRRRLAEHIVYGLAQQYWGYRVGQDPEQIPWINQGLSLFLTQTYMQQTEHKPFLLGEVYVDAYLRAARQGWNTALTTSRLKLSRQSLDAFQVLAQGKGYTLFRLLERILGKQVIQQAENQLLQQYRGKALTAEALQKTLETISGKDLDWFFMQWVKRGDTLDYAVVSATQSRQSNGVKATIEVQKLGQVNMPVTLALRLNNGETLFKLWDGSQSSARLTYDLKLPLTEVTLDPSGATPDMDRDNNHFKLPALPPS